MSVIGRHGGRNRKLREHIFNSEDCAESEPEVVRGYEFSKPAPNAFLQ